VSTGAVALRGVVGAVVAGFVAVVPLVAVRRVVVGAPLALVVAGAAGLFSLPEETTTATTAPATAATATAAASRAFFTGSEATLARPCQNRSKAS
jgi:hypothetical protein